jgi:two-component system response regulator AtoC
LAPIFKAEILCDGQSQLYFLQLCLERSSDMTIQGKQILLVDDEEKLLRSMSQRLKVLGFATFTATSGMDAIDIAMKNQLDLAIVDLKMPDMNGLVTITKLKEIRPTLKTILLTGHGNEKVKQATESLNTLYFEKEEMSRLWQFIKKLNTDDKVVIIRPPGASRRMSGETGPSFPANEIEIRSHHDFADNARRPALMTTDSIQPGDTTKLRIVGETPAMQALQKNIARMAPLDCTVTLRGEPGTGKELAARAIHAGSMRRDQRFLAINCANFCSEQLAGQLLGYQGGHLSVAIRNHSGIFSPGQLGTLLFDRVEDMPDEMQEQLLSTIDMADQQRSNEIKDTSIDIRILVATRVDLSKRVKTGAFKKDLYERLKPSELFIPPLRDRKDDISLLCQYFFDKYRQELGKPVNSISPEVVKILVDYHFPGNVSELEHLIERAVIIADGDIIERRHLPERFIKQASSTESPASKHFSTLADLEKRYIVEVLEATNGNKSKAAEILGISRAALWRKLKQIHAPQT